MILLAERKWKIFEDKLLDNQKQGEPLSTWLRVSLHTIYNIRHFAFYFLKGTVAWEIFGPVFWAVWIYLGLNVNRLCFFNLNDALLIYILILSFDAFQAEHSPRFLESRRMIGNWVCGTPIFADFWLAVLRETLLRVEIFLGESYFLGWPVTSSEIIVIFRIF
jgi:hypothetical protein